MGTLNLGKLTKSNFFVSITTAAIVIGSISFTTFAATQAPTGYTICVNNSTRALTFPPVKKSICPLGTTKIVMGVQGPVGQDGTPGTPGATGAQGVPGEQGSQGVKGDTGPAGKDGLPGAPGGSGPQGPAGPGGLNQLQGIIQTVIPKVASAIYSVTCAGITQSAVGISAPVSQAKNLHSYSLTGLQSLAITELGSFSDCLGQTVSISQNSGFSSTGKVIEVDRASNIVLIGSAAVLHTLSPAVTAPTPGDFIFSAGGNNGVDAGAAGAGIFHHLLPDNEEEAYTILGGNSRAVAVNVNGDFIHIASHKPGTFCRFLITCPTGSTYLAWSHPIAFVTAPPTSVTASISGEVKTISWVPPTELLGLHHYEVLIFQLSASSINFIDPYKANVASAKLAYDAAAKAYLDSATSANLDAKNATFSALATANRNLDSIWNKIFYSYSEKRVISVEKTQSSFSTNLLPGYEQFRTLIRVLAVYSSAQISSSATIASLGQVVTS
jgi:hypothetical protein